MPSIRKTRRLLQILSRLQTGRSFNATELAQFCGVSRRTVFRDLQELQLAGVPLLYDQEKQGYWLPGNECVAALSLSWEQALSMVLLCEGSGDHETGIPYLDSAAQAGQQLLDALPDERRTRLSRIASQVDVRFGLASEAACPKELFDAAVESLTDRRSLRIQFQEVATGIRHGTLFSPYRLLFQNQLWHLVGRSSWHRSVRVIPFSRICSFERTDKSYEIPPRFSTDRCLGNAWDIDRGRPRNQHVELRFRQAVAPLVAERRWHRTQRNHSNPDGSLTVHLIVDGFNEMIPWLRRWGMDVEVVSPLELRRRLREESSLGPEADGAKSPLAESK